MDRRNKMKIISNVNTKQKKTNFNVKNYTQNKQQYAGRSNRSHVNNTKETMKLSSSFNEIWRKQKSRAKKKLHHPFMVMTTSNNNNR